METSIEKVVVIGYV